MPTLADARERDARDPLTPRTGDFHLPRAEGGEFASAAYLVGNSLGLQPKQAQDFILKQMQVWADIAVEGHFEQERWVTFPERLDEALAVLVGGLPSEVVTMNSLTVNLHLMLASFYRPTTSRFRIVLDEGAFPSDIYAIRSHLRHRGIDPNSAMIEARLGEVTFGSARDLDEHLEGIGDSIALVIPSAINYQSGELFRIEQITSAAHEVGALVGWDLAHVIGNVPLHLHDWDVDFAVWCTYKYLNGGPGSIGGAFVHERHLQETDVPRLEGWWGNRLESRFEMRPEIDVPRRASAWALSTPPSLAIAPIEASLEMFQTEGISSLRSKSIRLTGFLEECLLACLHGTGATVLTPQDPARRGAQLSIRLPQGNASQVVKKMRFEMGVLADARGSSIVRLAPVPLYNSFEDCWRAADALARAAFGSSGI